MIGPGRFYGGVVATDNKSIYTYRHERISSSASGCRTTANVALPSPSDFYYTYWGMNADCYNNDFHYCNDYKLSWIVSLDDPNIGWLDGAHFWTLNPTSSNTGTFASLGIDAKNLLLSSNWSAEWYVNPVVYLKASVSIIDGTGVLTDPYILSS